MFIKKVLAQNRTIYNPLRGIGPLGLEGEISSQGGTMLERMLSGLIGIMTFVAGIWFIIKIIVAGYGFISAGGNSEEMKKSREAITNSLIGLTIVVAAIFLLSLIGNLLHVNFLDIGALIETISP